jgi:hypothetical protein
MPIVDSQLSKPQNNWPVSHLNAGSAGVSQLLAAPGAGLSHYITGFLLSGGKTADGFNILRQSCVELDAAGEKIEISDNAALEPATGDFAIEFWCKITAGQIVLNNIIHKDDGANDGYQADITGGGDIKFTIGDGTNTQDITSSHPINDGLWHHIVLSCDISETDGLNLYVDGSADATAKDPTAVSGITGGATAFTINGTASKEWWIGPYGFYKGGFLTAAQVLSRYNGGVASKYTGSETNISVAINIDEGVGTACYDMVASNDGTITNATWKTDGPFDTDSLHVMDIVHCANETQVDATGSYNIPTVMVTFPEAIKIGRNIPLSILETDGAFTLWLFGRTDQY